MSKRLSVSSPPSAQVSTENEVTGVRKVRISPSSQKPWFDQTRCHRRAYNLTVEVLKWHGKTNQVQVRQIVRQIVRDEFENSGRDFISVVCDEAVNEAYKTLRACIGKWKAGKRANMSFKSRKMPRQSFIVQKMGSGVFPKKLPPAHYSEAIPSESKGKMVTVVWENGRWFACLPKTIALTSCENQADERVIALDPGVRTFNVGYSPDEVTFYGEDIAKNAIHPLFNKLDGLLSNRKRLLNLKLSCQWVRDRLRNREKRIWKVRNRISDLVDDLHKRVAHDLVVNNDVILLPEFAVKNMTVKDGRKIGKITVRRLQALGFFKFRKRLEWMCKKYGKTLLIVNEAFTSRTCSWNGEIVDIGSEKQIGLVDRDVNGARGIFLRALTR